MSQAEREKLYDEAQKHFSHFHFTGKQMIALLDHIDTIAWDALRARAELNYAIPAAPAALELAAQLVEKMQESIRNTDGGTERCLTERTEGNLMGLAFADGIRALAASPEQQGATPTCPIIALVQKQAEDELLWFEAKTAPEAYLQQELRRLHAVIEQQGGAG